MEMNFSDIPTGVLCKQVANFPFSSLSREKVLELHACLSSGTTRVCPKCLNTRLMELETLNQKICPDCGTKLPWRLEAGQKSLL